MNKLFNNNETETRKRMKDYGNQVIKRKNSIASKEEGISTLNYLNELPTNIRTTQRKHSQINNLPIKLDINEKRVYPWNKLSEKCYFEKQTTVNPKTVEILNQKLLEPNLKPRIQTSKDSFRFKYENCNQDSEKDESKSIQITNSFHKYYVSFVGLENLGNTCYMNTSLQCLIHSAKFIPNFIKEISKLNIKKESTSFYFYNMLNKVSANSHSISPSEFKSFFSKKHRLFSGFSQHDSQEFLRHMLEDISLEMNRVRTIPAYKELDTKNKNKVQINNEFHNLFVNREDSIVLDIFQGQLCNTFECEQCKFKTYSFEKFIDLPILLDSNNTRDNLSLDNLLDKHFKDDRFLWGSKCEYCGKKTMHTKKTRISIFPEVLVISFQRYNYLNNRKNNARISFKEELNLSPFVDFDCINTNRTTLKYNLYAISNHSGSLNFGHYYAYCKVNGNWYEYNDSCVTNLRSISYTSETVYVLFYER